MTEARPSKVPNFFIAGVPKAGTTSLHHYLRQHPQVYMNPIKEPTFFGTADLRLRSDFVSTVERERAGLRAYLDGPQAGPAQYWVTQWDDYLELFRNAGETIAVGEASVSYFWLPSAAAAIRSRLPEAKLIFVLRDPADRLFSWYLMTLWRTPGLTFRAWFLKQTNGGEDYGPAVEAGKFATHLRRFFEHFLRDHVRVYLYEFLHADMRAVLRDMFAFLGVDPAQPIDVSRRHNETAVLRFPMVDKLRRRILGQVPLTHWLPASAGRALRKIYRRPRRSFSMDPDDRRMVIDYYRDEIVHTADLIGRDLSAWLR